MLARMDVPERTLSAALRMIERAEMADVLSFLTLEALRNEIAGDGRGPAPSPASIARAFSTREEPRKFNRAILANSLLNRVTQELLAVTRENTEVYYQAADTIDRGGGPGAIVSAVHRDLGDYLPTEEAASVIARERSYLLYYALADEEPRIARRIRETFKEARATYQPVYERFLKLTNRKLAPNVTLDQLYLSVSGYLESVTLYRRANIKIEDEIVADTVMRHFWAHTDPVNKSGHDPIAELWSAIGGPPVLNRR
jgi:hypothetical protein